MSKKIELTNIQKKAMLYLLNGVHKEGRMEQTMGGFAGTGKASANSALVYTPFGPKKMGDIKINDQVSNPDGTVARVIGVYPQGEKEIYKVTFVDGASTRVTADHLWLFKISSKKYKAERSYLGSNNKLDFRVNTTEFLKNYLEEQRLKTRPYWPLVPLSKPVSFTIVDSKNNLLINPYILGLLLGDGGLSSSTIRFSSIDQELIESIRENYEIKLNSQKKCDYNFVGDKAKELKKNLKKLGLLGKKSEHKFVPKCYLLANINERKQILQGLMDTDGSVDIKGLCEFSSVSKQLALDVQFLVRSLGGKATLKEKMGQYKKNNEIIICKKVYRLYIQMPDRKDLFKLKRKKDRSPKSFNGGNSTLKNRIVNIEYDGKEECTCIQVDHPNSLYITDDFIVTHNTSLIQYALEYLPDFAVAAYTGKAANVLRSKGIEHACTVHSLIYKAHFDDGDVYFELADSLPHKGIVIDEASMLTRELYEDLKTFDLPMIFVGDHGQLEPISSDFNLMRKPQIKLEEIHRNAGEIAYFAEHIRKGKSPQSFKTQGKVELKRRISDEYLVHADQVICAYNKTRVQTNARIRACLGYKGVLNIGERVMCLRNNKREGLFNGMQGIVVDLYEGEYGKKYMTLDYGGDETINVWYDPRHFGKEKTEFEHGKDTPNPFDYAYCITAHKGQGSEFDKVMVIEQKCKNWDHRRWAYTAATRAKENLYWILS